VAHISPESQRGAHARCIIEDGSSIPYAATWKQDCEYVSANLAVVDAYTMTSTRVRYTIRSISDVVQRTGVRFGGVGLTLA
jgi:hypothetical protein